MRKPIAMKKIITCIVAATAICLSASAQTEDNSREEQLEQELDDARTELDNLKLKQKYKEIWGKGRYTNLGYAIAQTGTDFDPVEKGKFGFFLRKGASYLFPGKPLWGMVKVGFDINWFDFSVAKYKGGDYGFSDEAWDNIVDDDTDTGDDGESGIDYLTDKLNIGRWGVMLGAFGIGPNVTVAPFSIFNNAARFIKASVYFRYQPTFGIYIVSEDGSMEASYSYCHMWQFGGKITWKAIGIGIEGHWGQGKFKQLGSLFGGDDEYGEGYGDVFEGAASSDGGKITRKFANTRFYLTFSF